MRKHGLACDNLIAADVVTADGQMIRASETENFELLWGLRGGGGNFGVVTSLEFRVHRVGPMVGAGVIFFPGDRAAEILRFYRGFVRDLPDALTTLVNLTTAPPAPFLPTEWHGRKLVAVVGMYAGPPEEAARLMKPVRDLGKPVADLFGPMPYVQMQSLLDPLFPHGGGRFYMKAGYLRELSDGAVDELVRHHADARSPKSEIHLHHFGGQVARVGAETSAYTERSAAFLLNIIAGSQPGEELERHVDWAKSLHQAMTPVLTGGAYINFLSSEGDERVRSAYGAKYPRLVALKDKYDPTNLFALNQNVAPSRRA
jgi:FAD/FMN-containing dehydrogenase